MNYIILRYTTPIACGEWATHVLRFTTEAGLRHYINNSLPPEAKGVDIYTETVHGEKNPLYQKKQDEPRYVPASYHRHYLNRRSA